MILLLKKMYCFVGILWKSFWGIYIKHIAKKLKVSKINTILTNSANYQIFVQSKFKPVGIDQCCFLSHANS